MTPPHDDRNQPDPVQPLARPHRVGDDLEPDWDYEANCQNPGQVALNPKSTTPT